MLACQGLLFQINKLSVIRDMMVVMLYSADLHINQIPISTLL